jgi:tetratricopeptide (TPR) repeat protein
MRIPATVIAVAAAALLLAGLSVVKALSTISQFKNPALANRVDPSNGIALANLANAALLQKKPDAEKIRRLATAAFTNAPADAQAIRTLGIAADLGNKPKIAETLVERSLNYSKRDLLSLLWLIEKRSAANDIVGTLRLYDYALRANPESEEVLLPILISASEDPVLAKPIADALRAKRDWSEKFWFRLLQANPLPSNLVPFIRRAGLDANNLPPNVVPSAIDVLVNQKRYGEAHMLDELSRKHKGGQVAARDAGLFDTGGDARPFDWQYIVDARIYTYPNGDGSLAIEAAPSASGAVAKRLVHLPVGRIRVTASVAIEGASDRSPKISMRCAGSDRSILESSMVQGANGKARIDGNGRIDADCSFQWIEILVPAASDSNTLRTTMSKLSFAS